MKRFICLIAVFTSIVCSNLINAQVKDNANSWQSYLPTVKSQDLLIHQDQKDVFGYDFIGKSDINNAWFTNWRIKGLNNFALSVGGGLNLVNNDAIKFSVGSLVTNYLNDKNYRLAMQTELSIQFPVITKADRSLNIYFDLSGNKAVTGSEAFSTNWLNTTSFESEIMCAVSDNPFGRRGFGGGFTALSLSNNIFYGISVIAPISNKISFSGSVLYNVNGPTQTLSRFGIVFN